MNELEKVIELYKNNSLVTKKEDYIKISPKEILDGLIQLSHEEGDFDWGVAWHPYPENLFDPRPWRDPHATETLDTQFITLRNLHLLPEYFHKIVFLPHDYPATFLRSHHH